MDRSDEKLTAIFDRTDGHCHLCHRKLAFSDYGHFERRGGWEIEHSNPKCNGGTDRLSNLYAAHIFCNRSKGSGSTRSCRRANGVRHAPLSVEKKEEIRSNNRWGWGVGGAGLGALVFGPGGALILGLLGACIGDSIEPTR